MYLFSFNTKIYKLVNTSFIKLIFMMNVTDVTLHIMITMYTNNKVNKSLVNFAIKAQFRIKLQKA